MKRFYKNFQLIELRNKAGKYKLLADNEFWNCKLSKLGKLCNGAGPEWLSFEYRKFLTEILDMYEAAFAIHDFDCGSKKISRTKADLRLLCNLFLTWIYFFKGKIITKTALNELFVIIPAIYKTVRCFSRYK